jgi:hypothetical protein
MLQDNEEIMMFQVAITSFICGLINEKAVSVKLENDELVAILSDFKNGENSSNEIYVKAKRNPFTTEIEITDPTSIRINKCYVKDINALIDLGFSQEHLTLLKHNLSATIYLEKIYEQSKTQPPKILNILEEILNTKLDFNDRQKPGALAQLYSLLPQREAFILSDTCGNVDGSTGNPLKNVMCGQIDNAIEYHPISIAFHHGISKLHIVPCNSMEIRSFGTVPERLKQSLAFLTTGSIPMHQYTFQIINQNSPSPLQTNDYLSAFTLLSKRSFAPAIGDFQIKTSIPAQISSEMRTIDWSIAHDVMYSSDIVEQLAQKQLLPKNFWVQLTQYASQVNKDDRTTFLIRDGLQDAVSNNQQKGIPKELTPITSCTLTSRNILTPGKSLFESMIEYGFDGLDLFKNISRSMIHSQLDLIRLGWIPDSHTQNIIYLFDFKRKIFSGILQRDAECEKINLDKLRKHGIQLKPADQVNHKLLRSLIHNDEKLNTLYLHHTIYTKHIIPLVNILNEKYNIDPAMLCQYVRQCLVEWKRNNLDYDIEQDIDLSGRYYERNLACKTLNIGEPPHYRLIYNHPLLPQNFD